MKKFNYMIMVKLLIIATIFSMICGRLSNVVLANEKPDVATQSVEKIPDSFHTLTTDIDNYLQLNNNALTSEELDKLRKNMSSLAENTNSKLSSRVASSSTYVDPILIYEREYNDSSAYADVISYDLSLTPNAAVNGAINDIYDLDVYKFSTSRSGNLTIYGLWYDLFYNNGWEDDLLFGLYDSNWNLISAATLYNFANGTATRYMNKYINAGTYYIGVLASNNYGDLYVGETYALLTQFEPDPVVVSSIGINSLPSQTHYTKGDLLNLQGGQLVVRDANSSNTFIAPMSEATVRGFDPYSSIYGPQTIIVEYGGATTSFTVYLNRFSDVPYGHVFYSTIMELTSKGVVNGYEDGRYGANDNITRAEVAVMLVRALGLNTTGMTSNFTDVSNSHWAATYIATAANAKILNGYGDGRFGPEDKITRAQLSVMVANAFQINVNASIPKSFIDVPKDHWAGMHIQALASNGIVSGYSNGRFGVNDYATRAQFTKFLSYSMNIATTRNR